MVKVVEVKYILILLTNYVNTYNTMNFNTIYPYYSLAVKLKIRIDSIITIIRCNAIYSHC